MKIYWKEKKSRKGRRKKKKARRERAKAKGKGRKGKEEKENRRKGEAREKKKPVGFHRLSSRITLPSLAFLLPFFFALLPSPLLLSLL